MHTHAQIGHKLFIQGASFLASLQESDIKAHSSKLWPHRVSCLEEC